MCVLPAVFGFLPKALFTMLRLNYAPEVSGELRLSSTGNWIYIFVDFIPNHLYFSDTDQAGGFPFPPTSGPRHKHTLFHPPTQDPAPELSLVLTKSSQTAPERTAEQLLPRKPRP
ncbi:hypothetical protein ILYODFUR_009526 [Ilyodon furcidens]|uniref:Uncharacterized protein n=1 Tax=Ilyodon furcidens TaxID=33524 RepID=A0ABV0TX15_9TELE